MTEYQALQLLRSAGVAGVRNGEPGSSLILTICSHGFSDELPLSRLKSDVQRQAHLLGEQVHTVEENSFAQRVKVRISLGGDESREMEVLKSNNQLTQEERLEKKRLLSELDLEIKHCQAVLAALRYLQVYHREISGKLKGIVPEAVSLRPEPSSRVGKVLWTKGVNSAAHHCHSEGKRQQASDAHLLQLCEAFLARYVIQEEPAYTSEQLFNNVRQIRLLDASE